MVTILRRHVQTFDFLNKTRADHSVPFSPPVTHFILPFSLWSSLFCPQPLVAYATCSNHAVATQKSVILHLRNLRQWIVLLQRIGQPLYFLSPPTSSNLRPMHHQNFWGTTTKARPLSCNLTASFGATHPLVLQSDSSDIRRST